MEGADADKRGKKRPKGRTGEEPTGFSSFPRRVLITPQKEQGAQYLCTTKGEPAETKKAAHNARKAGLETDIQNKTQSVSALVVLRSRNKQREKQQREMFLQISVTQF